MLTGLLKLHYHQLDVDWENVLVTSKILNHEMEEGAKILLLLGKGLMAKGGRPKPIKIASILVYSDQKGYL